MRQPRVPVNLYGAKKTRPSWLFSTAIVIAFTSWFPSPVSAGAESWLSGKDRFELQTNPNLDLCQELEKNLEEHEPYPRAMCPSSIPLPDNPDFQRPKWETLSLDENRDLAIRFYLEMLNWRSFASPDAGYKRVLAEDLKGVPQRVSRGVPGMAENYSFLELLERDEIILQRTKLDLNFDGKPDDVYRMSMGQCATRKAGEDTYFYTLHVLDPESRALERAVAAKSARAFDVILFEGRPYLLADTGPISIFETQSLPAHAPFNYAPVCVFDNKEVNVSE